jgi:hypothetical protein
MARIRTIKPDFFKHESLFDAEKETGLPLRLAFAGLWTQCDRAGRFQWRPRALKTGVLPYDEVDFSRVMDALSTRGFIVKYTSNGEQFGYVPSWHKHQVINNREMASTIPDPSDCAEETDASITRQSRVTETSKGNMEGEGKGREEDGLLSQSIGEEASEAWNEAAERLSLSKVMLLNADRRRSLSRRLKELGGIEGWQAMLEIIGKSPHLLGENDRDWKVTFDWILKPANLTKVMEGNYVRSKTYRPNSIADGFAEINAALDERIRREGGHENSPEDTGGIPRLREDAA